MTVDPFEAARPRLLGLAYRMLGSLADAEDAVQDAWLRWQGADEEAIERPEAWLTTVTTRIALDRLRSAQHRREAYIGPWLPEPVAVEPSPSDSAELSESLTLGFLTLLDRLSPVERAVFLLAEVFRVPFAEVASTVGKSEVACRQIASRARRRVRVAPSRTRPGDRRVVDELLVAFALGDIDTVLARLAPEVVLVSDGGPHRRAARRPVVGAERVARFFSNLARRHVPSAVFPATINGDPGVIVEIDGVIDFAAAFDVDGDQVTAIWLVRNPTKLGHVRSPVAID